MQKSNDLLIKQLIKINFLNNNCYFSHNTLLTDFFDET